MPPRDGVHKLPWFSRLAVLALILAGYGLTLLVFYPGVMTYDGKYVYEDIARTVWGDWQSPAMTALWRLINPVAPGPASMFLLIATTYWLAFGLLAIAFMRRDDFARVVAAAAGADTTGIRIRGYHMAGRIVFGHLAAGRFYRFCCS